MLQVYDRVLSSKSIETLIALSVLLGGVFVITGLLDFIRMRILSRLGTRFELIVGVPILEAVMRRQVQGSAQPGENIIGDVNSFRSFISSNTLIAFFDSPWVPLYIGILFILHPYLGVLGLVGAIILIAMALINSAMSNKPMLEATNSSCRSDGLFETCEQNAELIHSMGMQSELSKRWVLLQLDSSRLKTIVTDRISTFATLSKTFRMALQSAALGLGAALVIFGETSPGVMIAATIILGRALAPIDQAIAQWRSFIAATGSYRRLKHVVIEHPEETSKMSLPTATSSLSATIRHAGPPLAKNATISGIDFELVAGDVVAVIGPSGSGKSTLARMLTGIWQPQKGKVALDGIDIFKWNAHELGQQIGYLPQDVAMFDGTIAENIARFSTDIDHGKIMKAAMDANVHEMILNLPEGYETQIGKDGLSLSGGQRQRIGLARAVYSNPFLIILDEPNSNLDATGDSALLRTINSIKQRGAIIVVMTHRPSTLQAVNKVLVLDQGKQNAFGLKEEVLRATTKTIANNDVKKPSQNDKVTNLPERAAVCPIH